MLSNGNKRADVFDRTGFDALQKEFKSSCQFTRVLISVLQERVQLENDYAKGLSKLHSRLSKATVGLSGSVANGWTRIMENLEVEARAHQGLGEKIASQLLPTSKAFISAVDRDLKPISSEVDTATSRLQTARREECKSRKKAFTAYCLTYQNFSTNNNSSSLDSGNSGGGIDSARHTSTLLLQNRAPHHPSSLITSSSTNSPFKAAVRSASLRRVATLSTTQPSMEMSSASASHAALPEKAARSVWRAVLDLYRSNLACEEARIEWHSTLYQSASKLFDLERLRLSTMQETLEFYRSAIMESIQSIEKAFQATKDMLTKSNVEEDFLSFHGRVVSDSNAKLHCTSQSSLPTSRLTNSRVLHRANKTLPSAVVGSTQQYLLCLPGEDDSLYTPSKEIQRQSIRQALQKRFLVFPKEEPETISNDVLVNSVRKSEKAAFARQLLMSALNILVRECQKEERTKQGLTNLVQVYSTGPIFTDDATLIEVRRRLFSSRCRLAHLLACRARFACFFHLLSPDSSSHSSSLQDHLSAADFSMDTSSIFSRRVDVAISPIPPSTLLEWPPVGSEVVNLENIPVSDLEAFNPLQANDVSRFSWMANADSLFGPSGSIDKASSSLTDEIGMEEEEEENLKAEEGEAAEFSKPSPVVTNGSVLRTESGTPKSPVNSTIERFPVRSTGSAPRKDSPPPSSTTTSKSTNASAVQKNAMSTKLQAPSKIHTPSKTIAQPIRPPPPAIKTKTSVNRQSIVSANRQLERKLPSSEVAKLAPKAVVSSSKPRPALKSRSKSLPKVPSTTTVPAFSPVLDNIDAFMDDGAEDEEEKQPTVVPRWQTMIQEKRRITLERVNGCGNALVAKAKVDEVEQEAVEKHGEEEAKEEEEEEEEEEEDQKSSSDNRMDKKKNVTTLFSRLGIRSTKQQKHHQRPVIVTPWRSEPFDAGPTSVSPTVAPTAPSSIIASSPPRETNNPLQMWPSLASLHCIGWAKVTSNYAPQKSGELALLEGEIVSILQKTTATWWMGEAGGKSGRFPVSHVEEF
ncbi:Endophilin-A2 [Taenia crassiceps]|uniref:Endophilin-A2 n=1 Tax=Taenia crassiceps TaxID=6207 RepID=A0ABR4Q2W8_9CEST